MDLKWLDDMYDSIVSSKKTDNSKNIKHPDYIKKTNELAVLNEESDSLEVSLKKLESRENLMKLGALGVFVFLIGSLDIGFFFSFIGAGLAYNSLNAPTQVKMKRLKKLLMEKKDQIRLTENQLKTLGKMISTNESQYSEGKYIDADYYEIEDENTAKNYYSESKRVSNVDTTSSNQSKSYQSSSGFDFSNTSFNDDKNEEKFEKKNKYANSIEEAKTCYNNLEKIAELLPQINEFDNSTYTLFNSAFEVSMKTAKFIRGDAAKEKKAYLFYNYVETLYKWVKGISDLEEKDVYDSLLVNIKNKSKEALPVLIEKINKEYYKFVNPDIYDLESEMTVMSNDIF